MINIWILVLKELIYDEKWTLITRVPMYCFGISSRYVWMTWAYFLLWRFQLAWWSFKGSVYTNCVALTVSCFWHDFWLPLVKTKHGLRHAVVPLCGLPLATCGWIIHHGLWLFFGELPSSEKEVVFNFLFMHNLWLLWWPAIRRSGFYSCITCAPSC